MIIKGVGGIAGIHADVKENEVSLQII